MGAAHQADAAKPWRSTGAKGFINDLSGMIMQGLGGYDTSRQQMLKENEEKAKYKLALEMQQDAIARAIEGDLYSRERDKEKLAIEREKIKATHNSDLARIRAEAMLRNAATKEETLGIKKREEERKNPDFSKNNPLDFEIEDHNSYLGIEGVNVSRASEPRVTLINNSKEKVATPLEEMRETKKGIEDFYKKYNITEENDPRLNTLNRFKTVQKVKEFIANLPNGDKKDRQMWADWGALIEKSGQIGFDAEKKLKGGILTKDIIDIFKKEGYITDFRQDYAETFEKKFNVMLDSLERLYGALNAASLYKANIDAVSLRKIIENKQKRLQKAKEEETTTEENKNNKLTNEIDLSEFEAKE
jgi:hypothetical protein